MQSIFKRFLSRFDKRQADPAETAPPEDLQVLVPGAVRLPLSRKPQDEISVPASINGRDLSSGRL